MAWMLVHHLNNKALFVVHLWSLSTYALFSGRIPPKVGYFKSVLSTTLKNDSDHIIVKYSLYNHTTIDLIQLSKTIKKNLCTNGWKFTRILFFNDRQLSRIKRKLGAREKNHLYGMLLTLIRIINVCRNEMI